MIREAKATLSAADIEIGQAFDTLTPEQVAAIYTEAAPIYKAKYGEPMPVGNMTYIRKRYDLLQRRARS